MMDIELCGLGATVVIWYGSDVLSPALGSILEDGPTPSQSVYVCLCVCGIHHPILFDFERGGVCVC